MKCTGSLHSWDVGVHENLIKWSVQQRSSQFPLLVFGSNNNFLINMWGHLMCIWLSNNPWEREKEKKREWGKERKMGANTKENKLLRHTLNSPECLPGSVSRSNQNGFVKKFVHTRYKLCSTRSNQKSKSKSNQLYLSYGIIIQASRF